MSHDLRDRARFITAMLGLATADEGVDEAALLALNAKAGLVRGENVGYKLRCTSALFLPPAPLHVSISILEVEVPAEIRSAGG